MCIRQRVLLARGLSGAHGRANGLDAAPVLKRRGETRVKILLVGDGSEKARLVARAQAEGLDNVVFHRAMPKAALAKLTASLGCGLMILDDIPAFYHGTSPNKFFDYLAAGIPVVNNYPGWLADLIRENTCGAAVPPSDTAALADALQRLAADPEGCSRMGAAARALGERSFARENLASAFVRHLEASKP